MFWLVRGAVHSDYPIIKQLLNQDDRLINISQKSKNFRPESVHILITDKSSGTNKLPRKMCIMWTDTKTMWSNKSHYSHHLLLIVHSQGTFRKQLSTLNHRLPQEYVDHLLIMLISQKVSNPSHVTRTIF